MPALATLSFLIILFKPITAIVVYVVFLLTYMTRLYPCSVCKQRRCVVALRNAFGWRWLALYGAVAYLSSHCQ